MKRGQHGREDLQGRMERMSRTRPAIQAVGDGIEIVLAVRRQVSPWAGTGAATR